VIDAEHGGSALPSGGRVRILVVDNERQIRRFLRASLTTQGYDVFEAETIQQALKLATSHQPELIILDLGLPDGDGIKVVKSVREWSKTPIIVLSVRGREADKISALDAGADDYLTKPFSTGELLARLRAALRRQAAPVEEAPVFRLGGLSVDDASHRVTIDGREVRLTATEYALLKALMLNVGKVMTHRQLLHMVWGPNFESESHLLRVNISNLRRKIEATPIQPRYLLTEPGVGYRLTDPGCQPLTD
jgi:two-component system KDP operon response regulator KdpE